MIITENLYMRLLKDTDFEYSKSLCIEDTQLGMIYRLHPEIFEKTYVENKKTSCDETYMIFKKASNEFCGKVELQHSSEHCNELGITLLKAYQNQGIGTEAIIGFCRWLNEVRGLIEITVRIDPENKRSQHVFEKLGAEFTGQKSGLSTAMEKYFRQSNENIDLDAIGPYFYKLHLPIKKSVAEEML